MQYNENDERDAIYEETKKLKYTDQQKRTHDSGTNRCDDEALRTNNKRLFLAHASATFLWLI